jgi:ankyrin repeat protein
MYAVRFGRTEMVKLLLSAGADFTPKDEDGDTVLSIAKRQVNKERMQLLLDAGAKE